MNRILSIDALLLAKWQNGLQAAVHSVYSRAIYLQDRDGHLFCLTTSDEADGPETARLDAAIFARLISQLRTGDAFFASRGTVWIGKNEYNFAGSEVWSLALPTFPPATCLNTSLLAVKQTLAVYGHESGFKNYYYKQPIKQDLMATALCDRAGQLLTALRQRCLSDVAACGYSLLGLGSGLTPSGDDFLAALTTVFHMPQGPFPELCCQIGLSWADAAENATTSVGALFLRVAAQGRAREPICRFLASLSTGDDAVIRRAARQVLQFGSSSGTDWLVGLTAGLEAGHESYERKGDING